MGFAKCIAGMRWSRLLDARVGWDEVSCDGDEGYKKGMKKKRRLKGYASSAIAQCKGHKVEVLQKVLA
jgi:hypothetical protein